ncbi:hypothetical protein BOG92_020210 [Streptomyces sp. WAC00263]|nr:hypothetical protein BOG92_020210 [Streptomyces sp. WAC00263]
MRHPLRVAWLYLTAENETRIGGGLFATARAARPWTREVGGFSVVPNCWGLGRGELYRATVRPPRSGGPWKHCEVQGTQATA